MAAALKARWLFTAVVAAAAGITAGPRPGGRSRVPAGSLMSSMC
jgi:hypothetical protein